MHRNASTLYEVAATTLKPVSAVLLQIRSSLSWLDEGAFVYSGILCPLKVGGDIRGQVLGCDIQWDIARRAVAIANNPPCYPRLRIGAAALVSP
jgi:hypothetical protein